VNYIPKIKGGGGLIHFHGSFEIEMANHNSNVIRKKAETTSRHEDLTRETRYVWNIKTNVIPLIREASTAISKSLIKYMNVPVNHITEKWNHPTGYRAPT
jgi:hypothetical protein